MDANGTISGLREGFSGLWERMSASPLPTPQQYVGTMETLHPLVAVLVLGAGLVVLLQGWRIFRVWVIVTAGMVGVVAGEWCGQFLQDPYLKMGAPMAGGLLLALLAWPLIKYALGLIGGLTGGLLGHALLRYVAVVTDHTDWLAYSWVGAIAGAILLGASAFFLFRMAVIVSSSLQGSAMVVSGLVAVLLRYPPVAAPLKESLERSAHTLPILIAVPAVVGMLFQFFWTAPHKPEPKEEEDDE